MGRILRSDINFCDLCGKRMNASAGRLSLTKKTAPNCYSNVVTVKSWALCQNCMGKVQGMKCVGEQIRAEIETKLANIQIEKNPLNLLK